jgi:hypothetical protein
MYNALIHGIENNLSDNITLVLGFEGFNTITNLRCDDAIAILKKGIIHLLICNDETACDVSLVPLAHRCHIPVLIPKLYSFRSFESDFPQDLYLDSSSVVAVLQGLVRRIRSNNRG